MNSFINIKEIFRSFKRNTESGVLSIMGLTIGITIALLIGFWSINEFGFDKFHQNHENKYRLCRKGFLNNESVLLGSECVPAGPDAKDKFPEIESYLRVQVMGRQIVTVGTEKYFVEDVLAADKNFFSFFSFRLLMGNPGLCLEPTNNVVIDEKMAQSWFKGKDAIGQTIEIFGKKWNVAAIAQSVPSNTHLSYQIVLPMHGIDWLKDSKWGQSDNILTYFELKPGTDKVFLAQNISKMAKESFPLYEQFKIEHFLQPLADIHFSTGFRFDSVKVMDKRIIFIFISIAALIMLIACFNFINLFISTSFLRSKSIGVKKIIGSSKGQLFASSFFETSIYVIGAALIALLLSALLLPFFNQLTGSSLHFNFLNPQIFLFIGTLLILTILISGIVPTLYITRQNPEEILRYRFKGKGISILQRILVISQFAASIMLISSSGVIKKQIHYIQNKDLGFKKDNIVYVTPRGKFSSDYDMICQELKKSPDIIDVTSKSCLPSDWNNGNPVTSADNPGSNWIMELCDIKNNYPEMMGIELVEGENPWNNSTLASTDCLINEQAVKAIGLKNPVGKQIGLYQRNQPYTIRGILKDANTKSLHRKVDPQVFLKMENPKEWQVMLIKTGENTQQALKIIEKTWKSHNPDIPFEYHFLDQVYENLYRNEKTANQIVTIGMFVAIFLAFMGLFAIAHYATLRRVKEVGVRKVNGAKNIEIIALLNRDFIVWVIIAFVVATPVSVLAMQKWMANFAYKTNLSWWIFLLSGIVSVVIAVFTVSWQSIKAANHNPVESLRYE